MQHLSTIEQAIEELRRKVEAKKPPRQDKESQQRRSRAQKSFWEFQKIYFPTSLYDGGFSQPSAFHRKLLQIAQQPGLHAIAAARKMGKTTMMKQIAAWLLLTGQRQFIGTLSQSLLVSSAMMLDIATILSLETIRKDFQVEFLKLNIDRFDIRIADSDAYCASFSEQRSVRGATRLFQRPQWIYCDDLETRTSSLTEEQRTKRLNILKEAYQSLAEAGTLVWTGNNFDRRTLMNALIEQQKQNLLPLHWKVHIFPAWSNKAGSLWKHRYPARSEKEMQKLLKVADAEEWAGDFQQQPIPPEGLLFKRSGLVTYDRLPRSTRGILYCDPNLAIKRKGDSTAITALGFDARSGLYYIIDLVCRSFDDSNDLLQTVLDLYHRHSQISAVAFDGNVSQESFWTNLVRNFCQIHQIPYPRIYYKRYVVDALSKNASLLWNDQRILFPRRHLKTDDGKRYLEQLFSFRSKKENRTDDAPDSLICALEFLHEHAYIAQPRRQTIIVRDMYH